MSIRALALDMYRAKQKVEALREEVNSCELEDKMRLSQELKAVEQEYAMLRRMLEGEKESGSHRLRFSSYLSGKK